MSRRFEIAFESFMDGLTGAGIFGRLRHPGAPSSLIDPRGLDEYMADGAFDAMLQRFELAAPTQEKQLEEEETESIADLAASAEHPAAACVEEDDTERKLKREISSLSQVQRMQLWSDLEVEYSSEVSVHRTNRDLAALLSDSERVGTVLSPVEYGLEPRREQRARRWWEGGTKSEIEAARKKKLDAAIKTSTINRYMQAGMRGQLKDSTSQDKLRDGN